MSARYLVDELIESFDVDFDEWHVIERDEHDNHIIQVNRSNPDMAIRVLKNYILFPDIGTNSKLRAVSSCWFWTRAKLARAVIDLVSRKRTAAIRKAREDDE